MGGWDGMGWIWWDREREWKMASGYFCCFVCIALISWDGKGWRNGRAVYRWLGWVGHGWIHGLVLLVGRVGR